MGAFGRAQMSAIGGIRSHISRNLRKVMPVKSEFPNLVQRELRKIGRRGAWAPFKLAKAPQRNLAYQIGELSRPPTESLLSAELSRHVSNAMGRPAFRKTMNIPTFGGTWKRMMAMIGSVVLRTAGTSTLANCCTGRIWAMSSATKQ